MSYLEDLPFGKKPDGTNYTETEAAAHPLAFVGMAVIFLSFSCLLLGVLPSDVSAIKIANRLLGGLFISCALSSTLVANLFLGLYVQSGYTDIPRLQRGCYFLIHLCNSLILSWKVRYRTLLWFFSQMSKLYRARSLLYRRQILQVNIRWKALDEIYKIYMFLHRSDLNISEKFRQTFSHFLVNFFNYTKFCKNSYFWILFCDFCSD